MINVKRTWSKCTNKEILKVYEEVRDAAKSLYPEYFDCKLSFYINTSTRALGRCISTYKRESMMSEYGFRNHFGNIRNEEVVILLSKYVTDLKTVRRVLCHEFGHMVTPTENHSLYWETRANKIGAKFGETDLQRLASSLDSANFRGQQELAGAKKNLKMYKVKCCGCGRIVTKHRMCDIIKHPSFWNCGICGNHFENI